jgi:succinate dehydrogenase/fumarate reductase flavoprotein subunit
MDNYYASNFKPYPIRYDAETEVSTDVLILGGGIAGCWAAISAARKGARVVMVEKAATIRSGAGGPGCDHWQFAATNPCCKVAPEELAQALIDNNGGYNCGMARMIQCKEGYDTLLELEKMGGKIRDTADEFRGAPFRDEKTKFLFAYDYQNNTIMRVWGTTFKPALYKECKRLGVKIYDRVMATGLLTEGGNEGARVLGATGISVRTGEFFVFSAKATVLCLSKAQAIWVFSTELSGTCTFRSRSIAGDGTAMAWRAGAELTMMERSVKMLLGSGYSYPMYGTGNPFNTWYPCSMIDANGKEIPWVDRDGKVLKEVSERCYPAKGQKFFLQGGGSGPYTRPGLYEYLSPNIDMERLFKGIEKGEFALPLYADLPSMPEYERRAIFGLMVGQESKTNIPILRTYTEMGFDPSKDLLQSYVMLGGDMLDRESGMRQWRTVDGGACGGVVVDWDLKTTLDGLYAAGDQLYAAGDHSNAATTGRYAGRKAAVSALKVSDFTINREQVEQEKARIYAPIKRNDGIEWKELHAGICRVMQNFCSENKTEELLNIGLIWLKDIRETQVPRLYATDPHKLMRSLEDISILTCAEIIIHASLARKASSDFLGFRRQDYREQDPDEWMKFITVKQENGKVKVGELPLSYWGSLLDNYMAHNKDYVGVNKE